MGSNRADLTKRDEARIADRLDPLAGGPLKPHFGLSGDVRRPGGLATLPQLSRKQLTPAPTLHPSARSLAL
jgi:hypothetical protein